MALTLDALRAGIDQVAPALLAATGTPGCLVTVGFTGRPPLTVPYGVADETTGAPMTDNHTMRVGSLGKVLVAAAIANLAYAGKLDLDAPIDTYLPFPVTNPHGGTITLTKALAMLTGAAIDGYEWVAEPEPAMHYVERELERGVVHEYGTGAPRFVASADAGKWQPSSFMYEVAAVTAEAVAGMPLGHYVKAEILDPLGMRDTAWWDSPDWTEVLARCATGHMLLGRRAVPLPRHECGTYHAVGAVSSSADFTRLVLALANREGVFRDEVARTILRPRSPAPGGWHIGFGVQTLGDSCIRVIGHYAFGWWAISLAYPEEGFCVTVCTNVSDQSTGVFNPPDQYSFGILAQEIADWIRTGTIDTRDTAARESYVQGVIAADRFAGLMGAELSRHEIARMAVGVEGAPFVDGFLAMQAAARDGRVEEFLSTSCRVGSVFRKIVRKGWGAKDFADPVPLDFFFTRGAP